MAYEIFPFMRVCPFNKDSSLTCSYYTKHTCFKARHSIKKYARRANIQGNPFNLSDRQSSGTKIFTWNSEEVQFLSSLIFKYIQIDVIMTIDVIMKALK